MAVGQTAAHPQVLGQGIFQVGGHLFERTVHQPPELLRRQGADTLVHRDHAGAVQPLPGLPIICVPVAEQLVLRVDQPQSARVAPLRRAVQKDPLAREERRLQIRLIHPQGPERARVVSQQHLEQREAAAAGVPQTGADHPPPDRGGLARPQIAGRDEAAAIFVAERKPVEEIVAGAQSRPFELCRPAGADPLQETQLGAKVRTVRRSWLPVLHGRSHPAFTAR